MSSQRRALGSRSEDAVTLSNNPMLNPFFMSEKAAREELPHRQHTMDDEPVEENSLASITSMDEIRKALKEQANKTANKSFLSKLRFDKTTRDHTGHDSIKRTKQRATGDHSENRSDTVVSSIFNEIVSDDDEDKSIDNNKSMPFPGPMLDEYPRWKSMPREKGTGTIEFDSRKASRILEEFMDPKAKKRVMLRRGASASLVGIAVGMAIMSTSLLVPIVVILIMACFIWPWPIMDRRVRKPVELPDGFVGVSTISLRKWLGASRIQAGQVDAIIIAWRRGRGRKSHTLWWSPAGVDAIPGSGFEFMQAWPIKVITQDDYVQFFVDDRLITVNEWLHGVDAPLGGTPAPVDGVDAQAVTILSRALAEYGVLCDDQNQSVFSSGSIILLG